MRKVAPTDGSTLQSVNALREARQSARIYRWDGRWCGMFGATKRHVGNHGFRPCEHFTAVWGVPQPNDSITSSAVGYICA